MDPRQNKRDRVKLTAGRNEKGKLAARTLATARKAPPKKPRMA